MPRVSVVVPAYQEGAGIEDVIRRLLEAVTLPCEIVVVVDSPDDSTVPYVDKYAHVDDRIRVLVNEIAPGPAQAIRCGIAEASAPVVVVTMADGCDDPQQIDDLVRLVERGVVIAAASRYSHGGQQVGGPFLKSMLSRMAGLSLWALARVGTRDATNSFKAYDGEFVRDVGISSTRGLRDRNRVGGKGAKGTTSRGGVADDLAGTAPRSVEFQARRLVAPLSALVALRLWPTTVGRSHQDGHCG